MIKIRKEVFLSEVSKTPSENHPVEVSPDRRPKRSFHDILTQPSQTFSALLPSASALNVDEEETDDYDMNVWMNVENVPEHGNSSHEQARIHHHCDDRLDKRPSLLSQHESIKRLLDMTMIMIGDLI